MMESMSEEVNGALDTLSERERIVLEMYFGINRDSAMTLNEIGEEFDLTRERVRQIKEKAIQRLRHRSAVSIFATSFLPIVLFPMLGVLDSKQIA